MAKDPQIITEDDKRLLTEHLITQVITGLSGRDGKDIVDAIPSRNIFAGVLQPVGQAEVKATTDGSIGGEAPSGTALGLDFRVMPDSPKTAIRLRVSASWSHYYAIFPSLAQVRASNEALAQMRGLASSTGLQETPGLAAADMEMRDEPLSEEVGEGGIDESDADDLQNIISGKVILPRVFRRLDVRPESVLADIPLNLQP